jgi:phage major head subunit gpT-like protein
MATITPSVILSLDSEIRAIAANNWQRVGAMLNWDKLMKTRPSSTKKEILVWMLETARIYPEGNGGNTRFDDMAATTFAYENDNAGAGLRLTKNELEDNQWSQNPAMSPFDYARKWAEDISNAAMFYPQQAVMNLITNGTTNLGYDGVSFFNASHPVNPNGGGGTYSNIITGVDIRNTAGTQDGLVAAQARFATALATVRQAKFLNGIPRYLKPTVILVPTALQFQAMQMVGAPQLGLTTNILTNLGIEVIVDPLLDVEPTVYYLGVADMISDDLGPFIWSEREPFSMRSYTIYDDADLNRRDEFEWTMKGRNAAVYGHPYLFYRCTT